MRIRNALEEKYLFFKQRPDATGLVCLNAYQKCTAALRMIGYGVSADMVDEYFRMGESTAMHCLKEFASGVVELFGGEYLRPPNSEETAILLQRGNALGFPGMLGSIDCCKWVWKNCPTAYHGQHKGKEKVPTVTMEGIADDRLYIWHSFFGIAGCNNDLTIFDASPLTAMMSKGKYPVPCEYEILGRKRNKPYWLADGIYPKYPCFVHSILNPCGEDESYYAARQEGRRKDIERAFGVLQAKFHILTVPCRLWSKSVMKTIMYCCVIMHNMVTNDKRPLVHLNDEEHSEGVRVDETVEFCFNNVGINRRAIPRGTIAALCATNSYLNSATEYMNTRR